MKTPTKDLFDDTTMTFGEHLEVLRSHLIKALIGLVIAVAICLYRGDLLVDFVRRPVDRALRDYAQATDATEDLGTWQDKLWSSFNLQLLFGSEDDATDHPAAAGEEPHPDTITVRVAPDDLARALHLSAPETYPQPDAPDKAEAPPSPIILRLQAPEFAQFQATVEQARRAVTLNVQEAFMIYMKVSLIAGLILSSPWIFFQLWQFVAAGLYPHEQRYVYLYGTMSLGLFLVGALFAYYAVFPFVLSFLLSFNTVLQITPQIRLSEWISFAVMLPLMFGLSFQLPLVMLFLERISIFEVSHYTEQRRMAILVISILSMILTPADPMSMLLMMIPLVFLYELGIILCRKLPKRSAFDEAVA